jgi:PAS domain S-box-containing protein
MNDGFLNRPVRTPAAAYAASFAVLVVAVLLRWLLEPVLGGTLPLVTLFGAVAAAVWLGGHRGAIAVALFGYIACAYLFVAPRANLGLDETGNIVGFVAYVFTCALIIASGVAMRVAQARAAQRRETFRVTLRSIGDAVITTDVDGRITYLNEVAQSLTGWSQADAQGQPLDAVFPIVDEGTRTRVHNPAARALREGVVVGLANHTLLIRKDGTECPIDDSAAPIRDERGRVSGCVLIFRDVTAQRLAERDKAAQLLAARLLASIVESSEVAILSKALDGTIQTWNAAAERLFGYSAAQAVGKHISLVIPPDRIAEEDENIVRLKAGQRVEQFETERLCADGRRVWVSLTISPVKDGEGNVIGASTMVRDITRERQIEAERQRFVTLVETSTDFIGIADLGGVPTFLNRAGLEMVGLDSIEDARRVQVREFFFPEDQARVTQQFLPAVRENGHGEIEIRFRHFKTGEARWMSYKVLMLTDRGGRPLAFATVSQDISERKRLEDHLRSLAAHLSDADRRKDEFLATLSHELRGPLAPLSNALEIWKRVDDPETLRLARETMGRQLRQLERLVDDLLDLNRITYNRLELRRSRVALAAVIEQAVEGCRPLADERGHELSVDVPAEPSYLDADPARLAQVFGNLLNNACKYTNPGGKVSVTAGREGDDVVVSVKDTGTGIARENLESIFDMFTQADQSPEKAQGGLGIGLTLVKRLVHMHGGTVEARSEGPGFGTELVVRLPALPRAFEAPGDARGLVAAATAKAGAGGVTAAADGVAAADAERSARRILIVDDNTDSAVSLAMLLQLAGNETYTAFDGLGAIEAVEKHRPEVVLLDIGLPKMNGHDVCRHLREQAWGKELVLIALTGWGQDEDRRKSQEAGFDGHLVKPVDYDGLSRLLRSLAPQAADDRAAPDAAAPRAGARVAAIGESSTEPRATTEPRTA